MTNTVSEPLTQPGTHTLLSELVVAPDPGIGALDFTNPVARLRLADRHIVGWSPDLVFDLDALEADVQAFKDYTDTFNGVPGVGRDSAFPSVVGWTDVATALGITVS